MYPVNSKLEFLKKHVFSLLKIIIPRKNMNSVYSKLVFLEKHVSSLLKIRIPRKTCIQLTQN